MRMPACSRVTGSRQSGGLIGGCWHRKTIHRQAALRYPALTLPCETISRSVSSPRTRRSGLPQKRLALKAGLSEGCRSLQQGLTPPLIQYPGPYLDPPSAKTIQNRTINHQSPISGKPVSRIPVSYSMNKVGRMARSTHDKQIGAARKRPSASSMGGDAGECDGIVF